MPAVRVKNVSGILHFSLFGQLKIHIPILQRDIRPVFSGFQKAFFPDQSAVRQMVALQKVFVRTEFKAFGRVVQTQKVTERFENGLFVGNGVPFCAPEDAPPVTVNDIVVSDRKDTAVIFGQTGMQRFNHVRLQAIVRSAGTDVFPLCQIKHFIERPAGSPVFPASENGAHEAPPAFAFNFRQTAPCPVCRPVVNEDQFQFGIRLTDDGTDGFKNIFFMIIRRNQDRNPFRHKR